ANQQIIETTKQIDHKTRKLLDEISQALKPGISEIQAKHLAKEIFASYRIHQNWHNTYIYFGSNTLLTYRDKHCTENILQESDIAYLDIAPIIDNIEGDAGHTIVFGEDPLLLDLKKISEELFYMAHTYWQHHHATGIELYDYV